MVLPVQSIAPNTSEVPFLSDVERTEGSTGLSEGTPSSGAGGNTKNDTKKKPNTDSKSETAAPQPGKIVDKSVNHQEKITTLSTDDILTAKADKEENDFIPEVEKAHDPNYIQELGSNGGTAHAKHN